MDLYASKSPSVPQKATLIAIEAVILVVSGLILFGASGTMLSGFFGWPVPETIPARRYLVMGFSIVTLLRMSVTMLYLMKRTMPWSEAFSVPFAFAIYYVGFAVLVLPANGPLDIRDWLGIALFVVGCALNTGSEFQRDAFKKNPANKGRLYTGGLFGLSRHINFFGDTVWVAGYALVTHNLWSWLIVLLIFLFFGFYNGPMLDRHLADHYGEQYAEYARKTKGLVPFIW
jgi:protein-S-isoprenylcysteine O-methyltransferase Ste14